MKWLDRRIAAPGPYLSLVLSQEEFDAALRHCGVREKLKWRGLDNSEALSTILRNKRRELVCVVSICPHEKRSHIEIAGLLVHEAVHVWQEYAKSIGEQTPGVEQEAYAIQSIAQELMAEYARRLDK
jgi:hypothetical protein